MTTKMTPEQYKKLPKCSSVRSEREQMAVRWIESAAYGQCPELDETLAEQIRNGHVLFEYPDLFQITKEGVDYLEEKHSNEGV